MGAPEGAPEPERRRAWRSRGARSSAVAVFCAMLWLVPVVDHAFGPLAGYGFLLPTDHVRRLAARPRARPRYWRGLKDYQA